MYESNMQLFLAFPIDPYAAFRFMALMQDVPQAKWRQESQLHLTLQYLGTIDSEKAIKLDERIAKLACAPLELDLEGVGVLRRFGRPSLHAVVKPNQQLLALKTKIIHIARRLDIKLEKEKFVPHVTLAYLPVEFAQDKTLAWLNYHQDFKVTLKCTQLNLYESIPAKKGNAYEVRATYPLYTTENS